MKLVVGLGNPGPEYETTRHNVGFMVVDKLAHELGSTNLKWENSDKFQAMTAKIGEVILVKPQTFMNNAGVAVKALVTFYKLTSSDVWVVCDDIDLPLGKIRIRERGGTAGHHGIDSIFKQLGSDEFVRFRLGIGRGRESTGPTQNKNLHHRSVITFVLSRFSRGEAGSMKHLVKHGVDAVRIGLFEGLDRAMNRFN